MTIAIIGLGKIGLPIAALYAYSGHKVIGIDQNKQLVDDLNNGLCLSPEPGLADMLFKTKLSLTFTTDYSEVYKTEVIFIMVPSPSKEDGTFTSDYVVTACHNILPHIEDGMYRLVTIVSTLMPGEMDKTIVPILNSKDIGLCYSPTFIALGNVLKGLSKPDAIVIGEVNSRDGKILEKLYHSICLNQPVIKHMSYINAELCKLLLNCFITTKISIANTCAEICEKFPGGNTDTVMDFLGLDSRIGPKCLKGGLGYGGTCFPRDSKALVALTKQIKVESSIQQSTDWFNNKHDLHIVHKIDHLVFNIEKPTIAVLGLAYKTDVDLVDESNALKLVERLEGYKVKAYDPMAMGKAQKELPANENLTYCSSINECLADTDLCVIATPWPEFSKIEANHFRMLMRTPILLDCWRIYNRELFIKQGIQYYAVGIADV